MPTLAWVRAVAKCDGYINSSVAIEEYIVGSPVTIKDNFRCYDSLEDSVKGYYDFISTKRYANLKALKHIQNMP